MKRILFIIFIIICSVFTVFGGKGGESYYPTHLGVNSQNESYVTIPASDPITYYDAQDIMIEWDDLNYPVYFDPGPYHEIAPGYPHKFYEIHFGGTQKTNVNGTTTTIASNYSVDILIDPTRVNDIPELFRTVEGGTPRLHYILPASYFDSHSGKLTVYRGTARMRVKYIF